MSESIVLGINLNDVSELEKMGYLLMDDEENSIDNNLSLLLKEKRMSIPELAGLVGVTRQSVNLIIRNKLNVGLDTALKISTVLGVSVEDIFRLTEGAWIYQVTTFRESAVFLEMKNLEIIGRKEKVKRIKQNGAEYFNKNTGELLTKREYEELVRIRNEEFYDSYYEQLSAMHPQIKYAKLMSMTKEKIEEELGLEYSKLYKKIGKRIDKKNGKKGESS